MSLSIHRFLVVAFALCAAQSVAAQSAIAPPAPQVQVAPVLPGDDFFNYVNGDWLASNGIPPDRSSWGAGSALAEQTNARIIALLGDAENGTGVGADVAKARDFYRAMLDDAAIEARGTAPLAPALARIDAIRDKKALTRVLGAGVRADVDPLNSTNFYTDKLFGLWVAQGLRTPSRNMAYLLQGGLGMPDRAYYLDEDTRMSKLRTAYQAHIAALFKLAGISEPETRAARVFAFEKRLAQSHATREESADVLKANNLWQAREFAAKAPGMDWALFLRSAGLHGQRSFMVWHPHALAGAARLVANAPLETWKDYLRFHAINHHSAVLPRAFAEQRFEFYSRTLAGTPQMAARPKRALDAVNGAMPDAVGQLYVQRYFAPQDKARLEQMVGGIVAAFHRRIDQLDWMAPSTRKEAHAKLDTLHVGIGYPERWVSYDGLDVRRDDAYGNAVRAEQFQYAQQLSKLGKPVDRTQWAMSAQEVNAVNLPLQNAMNFPAAILQPPFFDTTASDAVNYGAIGAIIGHEISHSFDDAGAQFDARGRLRDWWTPADAAHFKSASAALVAQYGTYRPFPDLAINGQMTLSENLADLAGLAAAYDAYRATPAGQSADRDGDRQFFIGYAGSWRTKAREAALRRQILTDSHAPAQWRTATVRNLDAWYRAFDVQPGQQLYLAPQQRVRVW